MEKNIDRNPNNSFFLRDAVIILFFTCITYYIYYLFYSSYLSYFGISENFLEFDIIRAIAPISIIVLLLALPVLTIFPIRLQILESFNKSKIKSLFILKLSGLFLFAYILLLSRNIIKTIILFLIIAIALLLYAGVTKLILIFVNKIVKRSKKDYRIDLASTPENERHIYFIASMIFIFFLEIPGLIGVLNAERQKEFYLINTGTQNVIVLDRFKNSLIVSDFKEESKELIGGIWLINIDEMQNKGYKMTLKEIGPIKNGIHEPNKSAGWEIKKSFNFYYNKYLSGKLFF